MNHYHTFIEAVNKGIFDEDIDGVYFRSIPERAKYFKAPTESDVLSSGLTEEDLSYMINSFMSEGFKKNQTLPLDELICIEDKYSAVFVENFPFLERGIVLTSYLNKKEEKGYDVLLYGVLLAQGPPGDFMGFDVVKSFVAAVFDDHHIVLE